MTSRQLLIAIAIASAPLACCLAQTPSLPSKNSTLIGHIDVFSANAQAIELTFHPLLNRNVQAKLYRTTGDTLAPATGPILIKPSGTPVVSVTVDFPPSQSPLDYILLLNLPNSNQVKITSHPTGHLDTLKLQSKQTPLTLISPPEGLTNALDSLGISSVTRKSHQGTSRSMILLFQDGTNSIRPTKFSRLVIVSPEARSDGETWISRTPDAWEIRVPASYFDPATIGSARSQARLKRILVDEPPRF